MEGWREREWREGVVECTGRWTFVRGASPDRGGDATIGRKPYVCGEAAVSTQTKKNPTKIRFLHRLDSGNRKEEGGKIQRGNFEEKTNALFYFI